MDDKTSPEASQPDGQPEPQTQQEPRPVDSAGPGRVVGCWIALVILAALVVVGVFSFGRGCSPIKPPEPPDQFLVDQGGIGEGSLEAGEAYRDQVSLTLLDLSREVPPTQPARDAEERDDEAPEPEPQATQPVEAPEAAYIITAQATNAGEKTVTYLKVHITLVGESGELLGETWVDAATASQSIRYARETGSIGPGSSRQFQGRIEVTADSVADAPLEITFLAVK